MLSVIPSSTIHHSIKIHSFPHFPSAALVYVIAFCSGCSGPSIIVALVKGYSAVVPHLHKQPPFPRLRFIPISPQRTRGRNFTSTNRLAIVSK